MSLPEDWNSFSDIFGGDGSAPAASSTIAGEALPGTAAAQAQRKKIPDIPVPVLAPIPAVGPTAGDIPIGDLPDGAPPVAPQVTPSAEMPTSRSPSVAAAAGATIAASNARSGRRATVLTSPVRRRAAAKATPATAASPASDTIGGSEIYTRRTLG